MKAREVTGAAVTIVGIILLSYGFIVGGLHGHIGSYMTPTFNNKTGEIEVKQGSMWGPDSIALILGWFMVIIGPALWFGEVPTAIKARLGR